MPRGGVEDKRLLTDLTPGELTWRIAVGVFVGLSSWLAVFVLIANTNWGAKNLGLPVKFFVAEDRSPDEAPLAGPGGPIDRVEPSHAPTPSGNQQGTTETGDHEYASVEECLQDHVLASSECHRLYGDDTGDNTILLVVAAAVAVGLCVAVFLFVRRRRSTAARDT